MHGGHLLLRLCFHSSFSVSQRWSCPCVFLIRYYLTCSSCVWLSHIWKDQEQNAFQDCHAFLRGNINNCCVLNFKFARWWGWGAYSFRLYMFSNFLCCSHFSTILNDLHTVSRSQQHCKDDIKSCISVRNPFCLRVLVTCFFVLFVF